MSVATIEPTLEGTLDPIRHDWLLEEVQGLLALPFMDLILRAQRVHRAYHVPNAVQMSTLLSIKTGACPEDCAYCPQSVRYDTGVVAEALMPVAAVRECAARAKAAGATRFCMGAAYRAPKARELRHPRDAEPAAGQAAEGRRPRLLQPQPRHLGGVLRRDHPHPHVSATARHPRGSARGGTEGLLRRHHRHGRVAGRPCAAAADAR